MTTSSITQTVRRADRFGLIGRPREIVVLHAGVFAAAVLAIVIGLLNPGEAPGGGPLSPPAAAGVAAAVVAAGQLARLRFRLGRGSVSVSWGEGAFILGFALAPPGWVPAATFVGAAGAWLLISWLSDHQSVTDILHLASSLTVGAAGAVLVASLVAAGAPVWDGRTLIGLVAGACAYLIITLGLATVTLALHRDAPLGQILVRALSAKVPMLVGNALIALFGLWVLLREPLWLLAFPPALWLLQRTYRHNIVAEEERRFWTTFAEATATLPAATEAEVIRSGLREALRVFGARRAEIELVKPGGGLRRYYRDAPGQDVAASGLPGPVITRTMTVAGTSVGELTVWLADPTMPVTRDELAVSAYGDALAGALHDAATRERLTELEARVARDSVRDPLTGLMNRSALLAEGDTTLRTLDRDRTIGMLLLDLRRFREVNDTLGHRSGDEVLAEIAERLRAEAREGELVARIGDDEFALLMPTVLTLADSAFPRFEAPPLPQVVRRARELADHLSRPMEIAGVRLCVEARIGVVVTRAGMADTAELIRRAGLALQQARELSVTVGTYDSAKDIGSTDRLAMLAELRDALDADDQIVLALQPAVDLETGSPIGVEALTRWMHPRRGQLSPAEFIPIVEHSDLLAPFTRHVLDQSLAAAANWNRAGFDLPVSVNISSRSLLDPTLPGQINDLLRRHRMAAGQLVLEITESVALSEHEIVDEVLKALQEMRVQLSIDDFGTGYSSLSVVTRVPVDELKVDRTFVEAMIDSPAAEAAVRGAVDMGERLNARVVAEGVETAEQRTALIALGCSVAQGYHFCRPMPHDKIVYALRQLADAAAPATIVPLRADDAS